MQKLLISMMVMLITIVPGCTDSLSNASLEKTSNAIEYKPAKAGDSVWIIINHIKPDKREQFEKFVHQVFWPMAEKLSPADRELFKQARILSPTKEEDDGTYSYFFIIDPVITGGDYGIDNMLKKMYGNKWQEYGKMFGETQARDQTQYRMVQDKYYNY